MQGRATALILLLLVVPALSSPFRPAVITWDAGGGVDTNWTTATNWSGDTLPGTGDVATFSAAAPQNVTINASIDVQGIDLQATSLAVITQAPGVTVTTGIGNFTQAGGIFSGGNSLIDINGNFTLSGGLFSSTSGTLEVAGAFTHSAGAFNANGGTVLLNSAIDRTLTVTANTTFNNLTISDGLFAHYRLDELASPSRDSSGNGSDGPWINTPTASTDVPPVTFADPRSLHFDGATAENDHVRVPRSTILEPGSTFTIMCWFKREGAATENTHWAALFRKTWMDNTAPVVGSYALQLPQTNVPVPNGYDVVAFGTGHAAGIQDLFTPDGTIADNTWYHVVGLYDPTGPAPQKRLYINGALVASETRTDAIVYDTTPTGDFYIGTAGPTSGEYFNGFIDDIRLYQRPLSDAEITNIAAGGGPGTYTLAGAPLVVAGTLTLSSGRLDVSASNFGVSVGGSWLNSGGIFVPRAGTVTFNSAGAGNTVVSGDLGGNGMPFNNVTFAGGSAAAGWTLGDRFIANGSVAVTTGTLNQTTSDLTAGTLTVGANGSWRNSSTGDVFLGGTVSNAGTIFLDGGGAGCGSADSILIRSTVGGTPRAWNGAGYFILYDVDVMDQAGTAPITVYSGTSTGGNGGNWTFDPVCAVKNISVVPTSGLTTTEAGGQATFTVVLTGQPADVVTIGLSSSNTAEGTVAPPSLTFTPANWNVVRVVTVTGVDDTVPDGNAPYAIVTAPAVSPGDPQYNGLDATDVSVTNVNDDAVPPLDDQWGNCFGSAAASLPSALPLAALAAMLGAWALRRRSPQRKRSQRRTTS